MTTNSTRSSNASDSGETTLSEFMARRYNGSVPVFGGDIRTGAQELGAAASADILRAVTGLTGALNRFAGYRANVDAVSQPNRITMADLSSELTSVDDAVNLDDSKIELLLSSSMIDPLDTKRYLTLVSAARTSLIRKRDAMILHEQHKTAKLSHRPVVPLKELLFDDEAKAALHALYKSCSISNDPYVDCEYNRVMLMAITHESVFAGRETNRVLAHVGDSVNRLAAAECCFENGRPVSDVSDMVQATQTDVHLASIARKKGFDEIVRVDKGIDPCAKKILATTVEAIVGAMYHLQGQSATWLLIAELGIVENASTPRLS